MSKKVKYSLIAVAAVLLLVILIPAIGLGAEIVKDKIRYTKPANYYADAWNIEFPESAKETYSLSTDGRDWWDYSVYTIDSEENAVFATYSAEPLTEATLEALTEILDYVQVPQEERPDFTKTYKWLHIGENPLPDFIADKFSEKYQYNDNLYVLYDEQTNTVYTFTRHI